MRTFFHALLVICRNDLRLWGKRRSQILATFVPPLLYLVALWVNNAAVGASPVAVVNLDRGPAGTHLVQGLLHADVFRVNQLSTVEAQKAFLDLTVAAVVTIPTNFTVLVQGHHRAPVSVLVDNINLDITNDIRRAVPDGISQYYQAQGSANPIQVTVAEQDQHPQDIQLYQYGVLPVIVLLLTISGVMTTGLSAAREWEDRSIKELLLSPASRGAIIAGNVLAGTLTTFGVGLVVFGSGCLLGWIRPEGWYIVTSLLLMLLAAAAASGLGLAIGALFQRVQPVTLVATTASVYLFFLAGGVGVLFFEPEWLQTVATFDPLVYAIHGLQMAVFYHSADLLGRDLAVLGGTTCITFLLGLVAMRQELAH